MKIIVDGTPSTEIDDEVVIRTLNLYPEEKLATRPVFQAAFEDGEIRLDDLRAEADKILIPWQLFLLTVANFAFEQKHIEKERKHRVSPKLVAKRGGVGTVISTRIVDRLIRQQNFVTSQGGLRQNSFCGCLKGLEIRAAATRLRDHFKIDRERFWGFTSKGRALQYLIGQIEKGTINVSRGTSAHKLLPTWQVVPSEVYRSTSGFVIRDSHIPFVFLPSEINPDEVESRQIYTLIYMLAVIGLEEYDYFLDANFKTKMLTAKGVAKQLHAIASEFLMPREETDGLVGKEVTVAIRDALSKKLKASPLALVTTLRIRRVISEPQYEALLPPPYVRGKRAPQQHRPRISTSVEKLCGGHSFRAINTAIQNGSLKSVPAQYLIFGAVNKKGFREYRNQLGI
jgi:hypothetical protein